MTNSDIYVVTVVRDDGMYSKCILDNPYLDGCILVRFDNSIENVPVPVRYNSFLDSVSDDCWIVFCHEDWQVNQSLCEVLDHLDRDRIYGPVGAFLENGPRYDLIKCFGSVRQCNKDGGRLKRIEEGRGTARVDTLDCQCVIVNNSLVKRYGLRFDGNLKFDMYVEDFCVAAFEKAGIETMVTDIDCTHYSYGTISDSFLEALSYMKEKYRNGKKRYVSIVGYKNTFGSNDDRKVHRDRPNRLLRFFKGLVQTLTA